MRTMLMTVLALLLLVAALPAAAGPKATQDSARGRMATFATGLDRGYDIQGPVRLTRGEDFTTVRVNVQGLAADTGYSAHLHANACDDANGGPHYMDDLDGLPTPPNELWLSIETNAAGNGNDASTAPFAVRDGARSVVIHDTDGARIACADLAVG